MPAWGKQRLQASGSCSWLLSVCFQGDTIDAALSWAAGASGGLEPEMQLLVAKAVEASRAPPQGVIAKAVMASRAPPILRWCSAAQWQACSKEQMVAKGR